MHKRNPGLHVGHHDRRYGKFGWDSERDDGDQPRRPEETQSLFEMSLLNDHILAEGVENLESESGRSRFFKNLQQGGLQCTRETLDCTLDTMIEDRGSKEAEEDKGDQDTQMANLAGILSETMGISREDLKRHRVYLRCPFSMTIFWLRG